MVEMDTKRPNRPPVESLMNAAGPPMYRASYKAPVFNHDLSYWYRAYGVKLADVRAAKIVIFGIPKSGNVWLQSLLCDALGLTPVDPMAQPDVSGVGMTHLPFCPAVADREDFLHGVCLVRDPRDALTSLYHASKTAQFRTARPEFHYEDWDEFYYEWYLSRFVPALRHAGAFGGIRPPRRAGCPLRESSPEFGTGGHASNKALGNGGR